MARAESVLKLIKIICIDGDFGTLCTFVFFGILCILYEAGEFEEFEGLLLLLAFCRFVPGSKLVSAYTTAWSDVFIYPEINK